jgi:hypothetical protein
MIKLRMAEEGIPLYPEPEAPEYEDVEEATDEYYFSERYFSGIGFKSAEGLRDIVNTMMGMGCIRRKKDWNEPAATAIPNICKKDYGEEEEIGITSEKLYDEKTFRLNREILKENKKRKEAYEHECSKVQKARTNAQGARDAIRGPIREAETRKYQCEVADRNISEYLDLADGDVNQAWKFFEKAYNPDEHVEEYLRAKHNITYPSIHDEPQEENGGEA